MSNGRVQLRFDTLNVSFKIKPPPSKEQSFRTELKQALPFGERVDKQVLHSVSGVFRPSRLTAILGPSGAGKSVLLNCLSGQTVSMPTASITGKIYVNRELIEEPQFLQEIAGYVQQEDVIMGSMTVREALLLSARLRQPDLNPIRQQALVDETLNRRLSC